jgi:radical SAM protein with 4Fe4S-binding SPASM domain
MVQLIMKQTIEDLYNQYDIVAQIDLDPWHDLIEHKKKQWLRTVLQEVHRDVYADNQRLILTLTRGDVYTDEYSQTGSLLLELQRRLNEIDISNFFVILVTNDSTIPESYAQTRLQISSDQVPISIIVYDPVVTKKITRKEYNYNSSDPIKINLDNCSEQESHLLTQSKTFCMYPWIHFHAYPTGNAYPCCMADMQFPIGDMRKNTIKEIWNQSPMRDMRRAMLNDTPVSACNRCYEQEASGFMSGRKSANKHHGHHINRIHNTKSDGTLDQFELTYWDIRFSNLCNLSCRSCGHIFSSSWYKDQAALAGPEWKKNNKVLNYAGRFETDAWDQLVDHIDHVEQIYFAGGEPLLMEEHYRILDELVRRKKFDVRLIYNTNFTHTDLKGKSVFEYWKLFDSVAVGASLDASGARGEYIRKGTDWDQVYVNRVEMIAVCPKVDFYISPTLSIMNAWHLPDFHREWVNAGLIRPQDLNVNILQDPAYFRIDIAPQAYKQKLEAKYRDHINWLSDQDPLGRATHGFESAVTFMNSTDNTHLLDTFWRKTYELDSIRNENILTVIPELVALK